ncbi:unnamed protein product [Musa acuminata subsp. malaccensis]|uniref:(wild Malaysian banana) hypothetical protein n=1 Tax=Musa acuminata subsp. malaccensis TaxID=214687 RepID=A0A804L9Y5_MUSAM|nr:PREDICTED: uncharacterized protein LOC103972625 [Musa acuminata subsp. malaccensis]CAG1865170.1 unnamed protein product [Musa acuminata subsp. malaccensis]
MSHALVFGVFIGAIALLGVELLFSLLLYYWISGRRGRAPASPRRYNCCHDSDDERSLPAECNKQGIVWVLEAAKAAEVGGDGGSQATGTKEEAGVVEIVEVYPVLKHAKIKNHKLILTDPDDSRTATIELLDCAVFAVSASDRETRKWANRYPIKLESMNADIYQGSRTCYVYLDTSWEKESWCKALRFASCPDKQKLKTYAKLREDFQRYVASVPEHLSPQKPLKPHCDPSIKTTKFQKTTRIRHLLNRFSKGVSKNNGIITPSLGKKKVDDRVIARNGVILMNEFLNASSPEKSSSCSSDLVRSGSLPPLYSGLHNAASDDKINRDDTAFFWNLVLSRLFFDVKRSAVVNNCIKTQFQRTLSNMRFPSFLGRVECSGLDIGDLPPYIHNVKVVSKDMNEVLTAEIDTEYSGGITFAFEVGQLGCRGSSMDSNLELESGSEMALLHSEGLQNNGEQMSVLDSSGDGEEREEKEKKIDEPEQPQSSNWRSVWLSTWNSVKNSVADQVSQVPLSLSVRISSLSGTIRLHIKPSPSDQLWFGFTSMPEMDWSFESSVGEQRINIGAFTSMFKNLFENAIRGSLVFPNCECLCVPWMLDEKDNWIPVTEAPFKWINQETLADVVELNQETPVCAAKLEEEEEEEEEVFMDTIELKASEPDQLHEATASSQTSPSISSGLLCLTPTIGKEAEMPKSEESQESCGSTPVITPGEIVLWEKTAAAASASASASASTTSEAEEDASTRKKLNVKGLKKMVGETIEGQKRSIGNMVGVSLKKYEKVKMHNIFGRHASTVRSLQ